MSGFAFDDGDYGFDDPLFGFDDPFATTVSIDVISDAAFYAGSEIFLSGEVALAVTDVDQITPPTDGEFDASTERATVVADVPFSILHSKVLAGNNFRAWLQFKNIDGRTVAYVDGQYIIVPVIPTGGAGMSISIDRYVSITSGVIGAQAVPFRELVGLRFTTDARVPVNSIVTVDLDGAAEFFGVDSPEYKFASQYFAYVSPAPVSKAEKLRFAAWPSTARAPRIYGALAGTLVGAFTAISNGRLNLTLAGYTSEITGINLTAAGTLAGVAAALQTSIRAVVAGGANWTSAVVAYDALAGTFNLTGGATGAATISVAAATAATDLSTLLGWRNTGTIYSPGSAAESPLEALLRSEQITDSFGSLSFGATITEAQALAVAQYVAAINVKYQFYVPVTPANAGSFYATLRNIQSTGLILNDTVDQYKESIPAAIMAATVYSRRNATVNFMYRQVSGMTPDVTTDGQADAYDAMLVNYYGQTSTAGQELSFFQRGFLQGTSISPLDMNVHANEQWLKAYLTSRLLSLQLTLGKLPANDEGRGYVLAVVTEGVNLGKFNGTVQIGKNLTVAQQLAVTQLTGDPEAWRDVQTNGYWADVEIVEVTGPSLITEYVAQYTLAYSKNDVVRRIVGSHNLV